MAKDGTMPICVRVHDNTSAFYFSQEGSQSNSQNEFVTPKCPDRTHLIQGEAHNVDPLSYQLSDVTTSLETVVKNQELPNIPEEASVDFERC